MRSDAIRAAAAEIHQQHQARRHFGALSEGLAPPDVEAAYRVQDELLRLREGPIAGWKIALTTKVMQEFVGIHHPLAGAILQGGVTSSESAIAASDTVHLGVESEIAVRLGRAPSPDDAPFDRQTIGDCVAACMAATELVDDRVCDYRSLDPLLLVADNAFNAGCVLGREVTDWRRLDLASARGRMRINGELVGEGRGSDVLGHPFEALAWLANHLLGRGRSLRAGDIVLTGSVVPTHWPDVGDTMTTEIEGLGEARLHVV